MDNLTYARILLAKSFPNLNEERIDQLEAENHPAWQQAYQRAVQDEMSRPARCRP